MGEDLNTKDNSPAEVSVAVTACNFCIFEGYRGHTDTGVIVEPVKSIYFNQPATGQFK